MATVLQKQMLIGYVILMLLSNANAQVLFSNRYALEHPAAIFNSLHISDSIIVTSGVVADSFFPYPPKNALSFFNLNGELLKYKKYRGDSLTDYGTYYNSLIRTTNGGYAVSGYTISDAGMNVLLMKFDSTGEVQFIKKYGDTNFVFLNGTALLEVDDGFLIGGSNTVEPTPQIYNTGMQIIKTDEMGNLKWWKIYDTPNLTERNLFFLPLDTTYLVGFERNNQLLGVMWESSHTRLMVIDTSGKVLSEWQDPNDSTYAPKGLLRTTDNGFAYCGRFKVSQPRAYDVTYAKGCITKLNSSFQMEWRKIVGDSAGATRLNQLKELADGSLIAAGCNAKLGPPFQLNTGWFIKLSANGDSLWERKYKAIESNADQDSNINDFEMLPDGGIIACGESKNDTAQYQMQQGWLIRLDSMGCLIPGCDTMTAVSIKEQPDEMIGVKVYPNPAKDMVYVLMKADNEMSELSFSIYDVSGKLINEVRHAATDITYMLNTSSYATGMYFIEVRSKGEKVAQRKFAKQK